MTISKEEPCIAYDEKRKVFILFYVDDIQVMYHKNNEQAAKELIEGMKKSYELTELGDCKWFLGIRILRDRAKRTISLAHDLYIEKIALRFRLT